MFTRSVVLAALAASGVYAQTSVCSQATATVSSAADATALSSCTTFKGSILVASTVSGEIDLNGPEQVTGSIIVENAGSLTTLSSTTIATIGESFTLNNLTKLSTLSFSSLTSVQTINWSALQSLDELAFKATVSTASSITITDTFLSTLDGIDVDTCATLDINNNNRLGTFSTQVANVTSLINIAANGQDLEVSFPNLIWAANMTVRNASSISIPSLATVNGSLGFYGNYFTGISAPNLTSVTSGSLSFVANAKLTNISMPLLKTVGGGDLIANNSALGNISFPDLATVGGAIDFSGNFSTPSLPALSLVKGGFNMQSTVEIDCTTFAADKTSGKILGSYTCKTTADATSGVDSGSSTSTSSSSSSTATGKKSAAMKFGANTQSVMSLSVVGGLLGMLL